MKLQRIGWSALTAVGLFALGTVGADPKVDGNVRRVVAKEEPPAFDYWMLNEVQRASYAAMIATPEDPQGGERKVSVRFEIRRDAEPDEGLRRTRKAPGRATRAGIGTNAAGGVEDEDGDIVGVLECNYSAGIPRVSYGYLQVVEADASGSCEYHVVGGEQPDWVRWDMVLLLQIWGTAWAGQETYSQTSFNPRWAATNTTVRSDNCLNTLYTNSVPVFVEASEGFTVTHNPVGLSLAWAWIIDCPSNPFY